MSGGWIQASVSIPCTASSQSRWRTGVSTRGNAATCRRVAPPRGTRSTTGAPPAVRRPRDRSVRAARPTPTGRSPAHRCGIGTSASVSSRIHESSRPVAAGMPCSTTARQRSSRDPTPATSSAALVAQLFDEQRFDVLGANAAGRQLVAIPRLGQVRLAPEPDRGMLDRLFERQVLERVQRVVVDEDADRSLRRQQVRELIDHVRQRMVR